MEAPNFEESLKRQISQAYATAGLGGTGGGKGDVSFDFTRQGSFNASSDSHNLSHSVPSPGIPPNAPGSVKDQQGIWASTRLLYGSKEDAKKHYTHLIASPGTNHHQLGFVRKMGFPEVIARDDVRNDLYVTLVSGELTHATNKSSDKNIEIRVTLVDEEGRLVPGSIVSTNDRAPKREDHFYSVVHYHEDKPRWAETLKIELPEENHNTLHIRFTFRHRSSNENKDKNEKPFALAWIRLIQDNQTMLPDGAHDLLVYKIESRKWEENDVSYKGLPGSKSDLERSGFTNFPARGSIQASGFVLSNKDSFRIKTLTCSTSLTQNYELLGLLDWESQRSNLRKSLEFLMKSEGDKTGEEVVKFLEHILDVLFSIMTKTSDYDSEVFDALVFVISLVGERRYNNFRPVMDRYLESKFHATLAFKKLVPILKSYIDTVDKDHKKPLNALKSLEVLMKFVVRSRELYKELQPDAIYDDFDDKIAGLLGSIERLMAYKDEKGPHITCQKGVLRHFPAAVPHFCQVYDRLELTKCVIRIFDNLGPLLSSWRLHCLRDLIQTELFSDPHCRAILLPTMLKDVALKLESATYMEPDVELCSVILEDIIDRLYGDHEQGGTEQQFAKKCYTQESDMSCLMTHALRPVVQTVVNCVKTDKTYYKKFVSILIAILQHATSMHYQEYVSQFFCLLDLQDFLMEIVSVFRDLVLYIPFPHDWFQMICLLNSVILKTMQNISKTLKEKFMEKEFVSQLWENYFETMVAFITQDFLQLETFPEPKQKIIVERYSDMRREGGNILRSMWFTLLQINKKGFLTSLVGPFLRVSLIPDRDIRTRIIPIFWDMLSTEYLLTHGDNSILKSHRPHPIMFGQFETELITQLDIHGKKIDAEFSSTFVKVMRDHCRYQGEASEEGTRVIATVERLIRLLQESREVAQFHDSIENRMSCTVNILEFYRSIKQFDLYVRYVYKLYDLHILSKDYTEAACTLKLHADRLSWSNEALSINLIHSRLDQGCKTHRELKEKLYYHIMTLFEKSSHWECALDTCKELQYEYENRTFEYEKLVVLLKKMSHLYQLITQQDRAESEFFKVGFWGKGFPSFLANREFIFRGQSYERLSTFDERIQAAFPYAKFLLKNNIRTLEKPSEDQMASSNQFLQICSVKPVDEVRNRFGDRKIEKKIKWYYKFNNVQKFEHSRPFTRKREGGDEKEKGNEFANRWIYRTVYFTNYRLPGILRWFPITNQETEELSPLQIAIETIQATNKEFKELYAESLGSYEQRKNLKLQLLMKLQGVLNAAVQGGIANYEQIFFTDSFMSSATPEELSHIQTLKRAIACQIPFLELCLYAHAQVADENQYELHNALVSMFKTMKKSVEEKYGKEDSLLGKGKSLEISTNPKKRQTYKPQHSPSLSSNEMTLPSTARTHTTAGSHHSESSTAKLVGMAGFRSPLSTASYGASLQKLRKSSSQQGGGPNYNDLDKRASNVSAGSNHSGGESTISQNSISNPIELSEPLTPRRPRRPGPNMDFATSTPVKNGSGYHHRAQSEGGGPRLSDKRADSNPNIANLPSKLTMAAFGEEMIETEHVLRRRDLFGEGLGSTTTSMISEEDEVPPPLPPRTSAPLHPSLSPLPAGLAPPKGWSKSRESVGSSQPGSDRLSSASEGQHSPSPRGPSPVKPLKIPPPTLPKTRKLMDLPKAPNLDEEGRGGENGAPGISSNGNPQGPPPGSADRNGN